jgi:hypothetical protein
MKLAKSSHKKIEFFFRETIEDKNFDLPEIYFYAGKFASALTFFFRIRGITFGRRIFISSKFLTFKKTGVLTVSPELAVHEIVHVLQYGREGFFVFLYKYFNCFLKNLRAKKSWSWVSRQQAYFDIPFEKEAREIAAEFMEWNGNKKSFY